MRYAVGAFPCSVGMACRPPILERLLLRMNEVRRLCGSLFLDGWLSSNPKKLYNSFSSWSFWLQSSTVSCPLSFRSPLAVLVRMSFSSRWCHTNVCSSVQGSFLELCRRSAPGAEASLSFTFGRSLSKRRGGKWSAAAGAKRRGVLQIPRRPRCPRLSGLHPSRWSEEED